MHLEFPSDVVEPLGHAEDGRDADAAGEQKRSLGGVREGKVILGLADLEDIASTSNDCQGLLAGYRAR